MKSDIQTLINKIKANNKKHKLWTYVVGVFSCIVFIFTIYHIKTPALTYTMATTPDENGLYEDRINEMKEADVLYIDDLFKTGKDKEGNYQKPTVADINLAFEIINHRYNKQNLYTIISSECTLAQILSIDEAVGGRIAEKAVQTGYGFSINPDTKKNHRLKGICEL